MRGRAIQLEIGRLLAADRIVVAAGKVGPRYI